MSSSKRHRAWPVMIRIGHTGPWAWRNWSAATCFRSTSPMGSGPRSVRAQGAVQKTTFFWGSTSRGNSGGEAVLDSSDSGGIRGNDTDDCGVWWRRWNISESVAAAGTDSGAHPDAIPNSDADANTHPNADANPNANTERWDDIHDYVRGRVTEDTDRARGNTRDVREQRHAATRDGLQSASGAHRLS